MTDEPKILIQNNGVINILITGNKPPVISESNIIDLEEKPVIEVLPGATDNVENSTIISPNNNEIDDSKSEKNALDSGEKTNATGGHNQEQKSKLVGEKQKVDSSDSPFIEAVVSLISVVVMIVLLIYFWQFIIVGVLFFLIVRGFWLWLKDKFQKCCAWLKS